MELEIRRALPEDAAAIVAIINPIIAARIYTAFDTPFTTDFEGEYIRNLPPRGVFHVATSGLDGIVGFQTLEPFAAYTRAFDHVGVVGTFVDLRHRRRGVASRLFQATLALAVQTGYEKLFTFVRADNPAALAVYLRQGFRIVGTAHRHAKVDGRYVDEVIIELPLAIESAQRESPQRETPS